METYEWLKDTVFPELEADPKNRNKGLIPRFHTVISDRFYGGTGKSLKKECDALVEEGKMHKAFIKFNTNSNDVIEEKDGVKVVTSGSHKGMKIGKDGRLSTPIYWIDPDKVPRWAKEQSNRAEAFRQGRLEFGEPELM